MLENQITRIYTENVKAFNKGKELNVINPLVYSTGSRSGLYVGEFVE